MDISKEIEMYLIKVISYDFVIIVQCFFLMEMTVIDVFNRIKTNDLSNIYWTVLEKDVL